VGNAISKKLRDFLDASVDLEEYEYPIWWNRVNVFLKHVLGSTVRQEFQSLGNLGKQSSFYNCVGSEIGYLEALLANLEVESSASGASREQSNTDDKSGFFVDNRKVFVVHGHDVAAKESIARFLEKIGLTPVILHEQPNLGLTVIEKFEQFSNVAFAIVLLTDDDEGYPKNSEGKKQRRARQNVVLELGYFIGKLGRDRVCALYIDGVEIPSDYHGVLYLGLDKSGAWRTKLAQELVEAGMKIDIEGLLQ